MKRLTILTIVLLLGVGLITPLGAQAQTDIKIGPRLGLDFGDAEINSQTLFIGGDARIDSPAFPVIINPTLDLYLVDGGSLFSISANGLYFFGGGDLQFNPYSGGGIGFYRFSSGGFSNTEIGLNFIFGAEFPMDSVTPFAEAQVSPVFTEDTSTLVSIKGGVLFSL